MSASARIVPLLLLLAAVPARAQNASAPGNLELYPTLEAVGVRLAYTGDDNLNATARLEWRAQGAPAWNPGMPMTRITGLRWAASVLWLSTDTPYEVRAVLEDPDGGGGAIAGAVRTRAAPSSTPAGATWWVAPAGSDSAAGTATAPLRTLQAAADRANPGDQIRVRPGLYYQSLDVSRAGTPAAPIHLVADAPGVILDGSDPPLLRRTDWRNDGGGIYSQPFAAATRLVCADSLQRLYRQAGLAALQSNANGIPQGWAIENGRLYVKLEDGSDPSGHVMHVARYDVGVMLDLSDWQVRGFEIRYYGTASAASGITLRGADRCVVSDNHVHTIGGRFIYLRVLAADNLIERNLCRDPRISTWPWSATKSHEEEIQGVSHRGGRGNVIRFNTCRGTFDGIDTAGGETDENVAADSDIDDNTVTDVADDALEPESVSGINLRIWRNRVDNVFSGLSIAPNVQGPEYVLYNTLTNYRRGGFKFSLSGTGQTWICHNTVTSNVAGAPAVHPSGPYSNLHFRNNVLVGNGAASVSDDAGESQTGCDFDGDLVFSNYPALFRWKGINYSTLAALRTATGYELQGRAGDPLFAAPASGDYALRAGSPAIDGAMRLPGINDVFLGAAPDMGALEYGGPDVVPPAAIADLTAPN